MTLAERIKDLRENKKISQEELGKVIGVNKAAIQKYESGKVQNIKRTNIKKLADYFEVSPSYLMGWDDVPGKKLLHAKNAEEIKLIEQIQLTYGDEAVELLKFFVELNIAGKEKAIDTIADLTMIEKYTEKI